MRRSLVIHDFALHPIPLNFLIYEENIYELWETVLYSYRVRHIKLYGIAFFTAPTQQVWEHDQYHLEGYGE
jgi:hypothetical protein